jgi:hypothetical protein
MKVFKFMLLMIVLAIVSGSCKRTSEKFLGPKKVEARADFAILSTANYLYNKRLQNTELIPVPSLPATIAMDCILLRDQPTNAASKTLDRGFCLYAQFSQEVTWFLTISQDGTGAEYKLSGTSSQLDSTSMFWIGQNTNNRFFTHTLITDSVWITLEFLGTDYTFKERLRFRSSLGGPSNLPSYYKAVNRKLIIVDNFDGTDQYDRGTKKESTDSRLRQEYSDAVDAPVILENSLAQRVDGVKAFHMKGTDANKNSYIGGINTFSLFSLAEPNKAESRVDVTDPADLYVNFYLYGTLSQTALQVKIFEIEDFANFPSANPTYIYNQSANDGWIYDMTVNWTGWKLVSIPYKDFKRASDPTNGGNGNGIKEPNKVTGMAITLTSQEAFPAGEIYLDYVSLTTYGPFTQTP